MSKKTFLVLLGFVFLFSAKFAQASLIINEIMYDVSGTDTDHEWIEVFNSGSSSVDITGWKFFDGSNHNLNQPPANGGVGSLTIGTGGYAILSSDASTFISDHSGFSGTVIDTVMSLNNTGSTLKIIKSDNSVADSVTYNSSQGASGDGNSLQLINGLWTASSPTPGAANQLSSGSTVPVGGPLVYNAATVSNDDASPTKPAVSKSKVEEPKIKTRIVTKNLAYVGIPTYVQGFADGYAGEPLNSGKYFWNFGDGDSKEVAGNKIFSHTYFYSGDYTISLEYYPNYYSEESKVTNKISVKVIPLPITISRVGDDKDFFVELCNDTDYEIDVSGWILSSGEKRFILPKDSSILSKKKMILSPKITNFSFGDEKYLKLSNGEGYLIFDYSSVLTPIVVASTPVKSSVEGEITEDVNSKNTGDATAQKEKNKIEILPKDLAAAPVLSDSTEKDDKNGSVSYFWVVSFIVLILAGGAGAYIIRRKKIPKGLGEDFDILSE